MVLRVPFRLRAALGLGMLLAMILAAGGGARAADNQGFPTAQPIGSGVKAAYGPAAISSNNQFWVFATADDGSGQYASYDGKQWSSWQSWSDQPAKFKWEAAPVSYHNDAIVFYTGTDGKIYSNRYDGKAWAGWQTAAGSYSFAAAPYATTYSDDLDLYAVATDGTLYESSYDGKTWTDWGAVSDTGKAGAYQPYALDWGNHENVLWTGTDGNVYWNRYDGSKWDTAKALPGTTAFADAPFAVGYHDELDVYVAGKDGVPYANVFDGTKWRGWSAYEQAPPAKVGYQPHAYADGDTQYVVYTGTNDHAYAAVYDGKQWGQWQDLGDNYAYEPEIVGYDSHVYLITAGKDGSVNYAVYGSGGGGY